MQKVFALLLTDLRRLGETIIFADFSKIVISTGKFDISAAKAYCDSLLTAVGNSLSTDGETERKNVPHARSSL